MKKMTKVMAVICSSILGSAFAAIPGTYYGAGIGQSKLNTSNQNPVKNSAPLLSQSNKVGGLGGRIFAGYNFNNYFGYEVGFAHYAPSNYTGQLALAKSSLEYTLNAADLVAKGYIPFGSSGFSLYGLGGVALVHSSVKYNVHAGSQQLMNGNKTQNKLRPIYGFGARYDIPQTKFSTMVEFSRIQGKGNIKNNISAIPTTNLVTFNLAYNFD